MFAIVTLYLVVVLLFLLLFPTQRAKNFPPGPRPIPVLGNLLELSLESPLADLERLAKRYGNVYSLFMGPRPAVVINGLQALKEALVDKSADFSGRPQDLMVNRAVQVKDHAPGVILADNTPGWRDHRRFGLMTLRDLGLGKQTMEQRILGEIECVTKILGEKAGKATDPQLLFHNAASNIMCQILFAKKFDYDDEFMKFSVGLMHETSKIINGRWGMIYDYVPIVRKLPLPFRRAFELFKMSHDKRMEMLAENKKTRVPGKPRHFIDCYLDELDKRGNDGSSFSEDQLCALLLDLHFAGTDTTANSVLTAFLYLMNYPEAQERCQQEIDKVLDGKDQASFEDRHQMPYTQGTIIIPNLSSVMFEEGQWKSPREFNPENFLNEQGEFVKPDAFLPFSTGPRKCLGEALARMELFLFVVTLLRKFKFIWPEDAGEPDYIPVFGTTQTPKPYRMKVQLRG
uniref:Cytochrome P450 2D15-like n=1 Tax=Acanthochromis polyacanthus TaxID=80966 RepID=A0A3Q1GNX2_9TELE